jgi:4-amino-4-deoxy-L-arabinose transferase-like glycosyltransferase
VTAILDTSDAVRPPGTTEGAAAHVARGWRNRLRRPTTADLPVLAIAALATVLYTWGLSRVGMGNDYYAAAVKAATKSWKAFFFGSIDPGNFITVDKPPAAFWLQALSARLFGFSALSMLLPEAACGVGSVLILHRLVRKWAGPAAAHLAALGLALTPVAVVMFRYNNPDALLTLLLVAAAWAVWSAVETGRTRCLVLAGALVGLAFDTKMLQAALVLPAFGLVYLWAGPPRLRRRIAQLLAAAGALLVSAGWWVAVVAAWPAGSRPFIGSTQDNSILSLIFGYNGLSRLFGGSRGGPGGAGQGGGGGGTGFGGTPGWWRMFNPANAGQVSWLLPLAAAGLVAGLWATRRGRRTDRERAGWVLWGAWTLVTVAVFSLSKGIFHPYYSVALAPGVAAVAGAGAVTLWRMGRANRWLRWMLPLAVAGTAAWSVALLRRTPSFHPSLPGAVAAGAALAAAGLWLAFHLRERWVLLGAAAVATATLLAGPAAYALNSVAHPGTGAIVAAGPGGAGGGFGGGGGAGGAPATTGQTGLIAYLEANRGTATYLVAAFSSRSSAPIIIATGQPVVTIGGFNGGDPAPTLTQFQQLVAAGKLRFVLLGGGGPGGGPGGGGSAISAWVTSHGTQVAAADYGGGAGTLYDLSSAS